MPLTKSAKKASKQSNKKRLNNAIVKNDMKIYLTIFAKKIEKKQAVTLTDLQKVYTVVDKALKKGILHKNTAARRKSLYARMYNTYTTSA